MEKQSLEKKSSNSFKKLESCKKIKCGSLKKTENKASKTFEKELNKQCPENKSFDEYIKCKEELYDNSNSGQLYSKATENYMNCIFPKCKKERDVYKKSYDELTSYKKEHMSGGNDTSNTNTNNKNSVKECETKFCKSYFIPTVKKSMDENIKKITKHITRKMSPSEKKDYFEKQKTRLKKKSKTLKKEEKHMFNDCMTTYCNKGCKKTIFEDGEGYPASLETHLRSKFEKDFKNDKKLINNIIEGNKQQRTELFKNKSTVLQDSFYKKLNKKTLKLLKSKKALSGCTTWKMA